MRKKLLMILLILLIAGFSFACRSKEDSKKHVMGSSGIGGSIYPLLSTIAGVMMEHTNSEIIVQASGGGTENLRLMKNGDYKFGFTEANVMVYAYQGTKMFEGNPYSDLRFILNLYPAVFQPIVHEKSKFESLEDLKGSSFAPGSAGSGDEAGWEEIFETLELTRDDFKWKPLTHTERSMAFKDRVLDCIGFETSCPSGSIMEIGTMTSIRMIPIEGEQRQKILKMFPWYSPYTIPGGTYKNFASDIETIYVGCSIVVDKSVSDDVVYDLLYATFDANPEIVKSVHKSASLISLDTALMGQGPVPLHSAAEKYYKEKGKI